MRKGHNVQFTMHIKWCSYDSSKVTAMISEAVSFFFSFYLLHLFPTAPMFYKYIEWKDNEEVESKKNKKEKEKKKKQKNDMTGVKKEPQGFERGRSNHAKTIRLNLHALNLVDSLGFFPSAARMTSMIGRTGNAGCCSYCMR